MRLPLRSPQSAIPSPWPTVISFALVLFFAMLADALLSFWVPNALQTAFSSAFVMGAVMGFSSLVGLIADIAFPQLIRRTKVNHLIWLGLGVSFLFILTLFQTTFTPFILLFLLAMAIWGVYYELFGFAQQQFVADATPLRLHSATWGMLNVFRSLAYFLGPLMGTFIVARGGDRSLLVIASIFVFLAVAVFITSHKKHTRPIAEEIHRVDFFQELSYWRLLFSTVWPAVTVSLFLGIIDATFWTVGAVFTEKLSALHSLGGFFLSAYMFPSIFLGLLVAKWGVFEHKKKLSELCMLLASGALVLFLFTQNTLFFLAISMVVGVMSALSYPLVDGVFSDISARMGREKKHLIGLSRSSCSIAYIIGPVLMGYVAQVTDERFTFVAVGCVGVVVSIMLLLYTPRKLKLPQKLIHKWD